LHFFVSNYVKNILKGKALHEVSCVELCINEAHLGNYTYNIILKYA